VSFRSFDFNRELGGGMSFKARHKDWQGDPMIADFSKWMVASFGLFHSVVEYTR
jgi:hypothetical protein